MGRCVHIVGGGVVGLFASIYLSSLGYDVVVFERGDLGSGASGHNAGVLHVVQRPFNSLKFWLAVRGRELYRLFGDALGLDVIWTSLLIPTDSLLGRLYLAGVGRYLRGKGIDVELVREPWRVEPALDRRFGWALKIDGYGVVEPSELLNMLYRYALDSGVEVRLGEEHIPCGEAMHVVAAGVDTYRIGLEMGCQVPRHRLSLGVMVKVDLQHEFILAPPPNPFRRYTKGGGVIPHHGYSLMGPGFQWLDKDVDIDVEADSVYRRMSRLLREEPRVIGVDTGVRPVNLPRDDFIIQRCGEDIFLYGIDSPGLTAAPALAEYIVMSMEGYRLDGVEPRKIVDLLRGRGLDPFGLG